MKIQAWLEIATLAHQLHRIAKAEGDTVLQDQARAIKAHLVDEVIE